MLLLFSGIQCFWGLLNSLSNYAFAVPSIEGLTGEGKTMGYVFCGAEPVGIFALSDACRTGAWEAVKALKSLNIKTAMLTGDSQASAMHAQNQVQLYFS